MQEGFLYRGGVMSKTLWRNES